MKVQHLTPAALALSLCLTFGMLTAAGCSTDEGKNGPKPSNGDPALMASNWNLDDTSTTFLKHLSKDQVVAKIPTARNGISYVKLSYQYVAPNGQTYKGSGLLCIPDQAPLPLQLVANQHGTIFSKEEAPTVTPEFNTGTTLAAHGYTTVVADYLGFGDGADYPHPYIVGDYYGPDVAALLQSAIQLLKKQDVPFRSSLFLAGYSEGGYATASVWHYLTNNPIEGMNVTKVSIGAAPLDLIDTAQVALAGIPQDSLALAYPPFTPYLINAYENYKLGGIKQAYFQESYRGVISELFTGEHDGDKIFEALLKTDPNQDGAVSSREILTDAIVDEVLALNPEPGSDLSASDPLIQAMAAQSPSRWDLGAMSSIGSGLTIVHCKQDGMVPYKASLRFAEKLGATIKEESAVGSDTIPYTEIGSVHIGCARKVWFPVTLHSFQN